jgi:hypothetical protein
VSAMNKDLRDYYFYLATNINKNYERKCSSPTKGKLASASAHTVVPRLIKNVVATETEPEFLVRFIISTYH